MSTTTTTRRGSRLARQQDALLDDRPDARLARMARLIRTLPGKRILDVGCSNGLLARMLGSGYEYYGCDITDQAARNLLPGRFLQIDLNGDCDLSYFRGRSIELAHLGGVLEYLDRPGRPLESLRELLGSRGHLAVSVINFQCERGSRSRSHHSDWVYRPSLVELRGMLARSGWLAVKTVPLLGQGGLRDLLFAAARHTLGAEHGWVRGQTRQFLLTARAG
ncbi:MAG TPA: methyltransferase domain-containing protein [Pirellulales bacterium]